MKTFRITKYNPIKRNKDGNYSISDWTSMSDIGENFNGVLLNNKMYLSIEDKYVEAIGILMNSLNVKSVRIEELEIYDIDSNEELYDDDLKNLHGKAKNKLTLNKEDTLLMVRLILRNNLWCKLEDTNSQLFIRFGHDYYMYATILNGFEKTINSIKIDGLYVENLPNSHNLEFEII